MTEHLLFAPVVLSFLTAVIAYITRSRYHVSRFVSLIGSVVILGIAVVLMVTVWDQGVVAVQASDWPAPFGITFVADLFSAAMILITAIMGLGVIIYSFADIDEALERAGYHGLYHVLLAGVFGAFLTGDVFNLYVWFEVMLMASFGLMVLGGTKAQIDGGIKYVAINLVATVSFLIAVAVLYGLTGTLNMADLHLAVQEVEDKGLLTVVATLFIFGFGIKAAAFPLFFWLPASYHTPPVAVSAIFAGLLTKVGIYSLIRMFTLVFTHDVAYTHGLLLLIGGLTMVTGVLGAAAHYQVRRILSVHIVSQIGYMIMGLALYTPLAVAGAIFHLIHNIIVKGCLFLVSGVINRFAGSFELKQIGGLWKSKPVIGLLFAIPAFSLAGIPPLSGFWGKFILVKAGLDAEAYFIAGTALFVGLLTLYSMVKIWNEAFWKPHPQGDAGVTPSLGSARTALLLTPIIALTALTVIIGVFTQPFFDYTLRAAEQLLSNQAYVDAVLGERAATLTAASGG